MIKKLKKLYHLCFISETDKMNFYNLSSKGLKNITEELITEYYNQSDEIIAQDILINQSEQFVPINVTNNNLSIAVPPINYPRQVLKYVQTYQFPSIIWDTIFISMYLSINIQQLDSKSLIL